MWLVIYSLAPDLKEFGKRLFMSNSPVYPLNEYTITRAKRLTGKRAVRTPCEWAKVSINLGWLLVTKQKTSVLHFKTDDRMRNLVVRCDASTYLCSLLELIWDLASVNVSSKARQQMIETWWGGTFERELRLLQICSWQGCHADPTLLFFPPSWLPQVKYFCFSAISLSHQEPKG